MAVATTVEELDDDEAGHTEFHSIFSSNLLRLQQLFVANVPEIRIEGGAARELLDGRTPSDLDLATTAIPHVMKKMFEAMHSHAEHER